MTNGYSPSGFEFVLQVRDVSLETIMVYLVTHTNGHGEKSPQNVFVSLTFPNMSKTALASSLSLSFSLFSQSLSLSLFFALSIYISLPVLLCLARSH